MWLGYTSMCSWPQHSKISQHFFLMTRNHKFLRQGLQRTKKKPHKQRREAWQCSCLHAHWNVSQILKRHYRSAAHCSQDADRRRQRDNTAPESCLQCHIRLLLLDQLSAIRFRMKKHFLWQLLWCSTTISLAYMFCQCFHLIKSYASKKSKKTKHIELGTKQIHWINQSSKCTDPFHNSFEDVFQTLTSGVPRFAWHIGHWNVFRVQHRGPQPCNCK